LAFLNAGMPALSADPPKALKGFILVVPERRSPEYLQKFIQSQIEKRVAADQSREHQG